MYLISDMTGKSPSATRAREGKMGTFWSIEENPNDFEEIKHRSTIQKKNINEMTKTLDCFQNCELTNTPKTY